MTAAALSVRDLSKSFGAIVVAQSIDVDLVASARVGLIGPNGAGKTTFVNLLTGFLKPDSGTIEMGGVHIEREKPEDRVRRGLVRTHQINALLMESIARDNVAVAIAERDRYAWRAIRYTPQWRACLDEAQERLREIGLGNAADREVRYLPYGEQRLLEIAIALALKPKVLLLDEPGAGIPASEVHVIHEALDRLPHDIAILIIEHDMELIFRFAREIVVMVHGRILTRGAPAEISVNPEVRAVYLGQTIT
jgi:branched-chain amino acid transport system ATP-binding protein